MIRISLICFLCISSISSTFLGDSQEEPSPNIVSVGPWVTVRDSGWRQNLENTESAVGFDASSALRFGLGAIIIMLIISTAFSLGQKLYPNIAELVASNAEGRSLEEMSSLAQYAFEAFEKYQTLNDMAEN